MSPVLRAFQASLLACALLACGCHAPTSSLGLNHGRLGESGSLQLRVVLPKVAPNRHVSAIATNTTQSIVVTVSGPQTPLADFSQTYPISGPTTNVTVTGLPVGRNLTIEIDAYDGAPSGGNPTGNLLEKVYGLVDIQSGVTSAANVSWATTPTALALITMRAHGDRARLAQTNGSQIQALVSQLENAPTFGASNTHPTLIDGQKLGQLMMYDTLISNTPVENGYAIPASNATGVADLLVPPASIASASIYDVRGQAQASPVELIVNDPVSAIATTAPYAFREILPSNWQVYSENTVPPALPDYVPRSPTGVVNVPTSNAVPPIIPGFWQVIAKDTSNGRRFAFNASFDSGQSNTFDAAYLAGYANPLVYTGSLNAPQEACVDATGDLFVADTGNNRVVMIDPTGALSVVAGTGATGVPLNSDNLSSTYYPATTVPLNAPKGVAVDPQGNVFIADTGNNEIRYVNHANHDIYLLAGTGTIPAPAYGTDGVANTVNLNGPTNLILGGSPLTMYFHDTQNQAIRSIVIGSSLITISSVSTVLQITDGVTRQNPGLAYQTVSGHDYFFYCKGNPPQVIQIDTANGFTSGIYQVVAGGGSSVTPEDGMLISGSQTALHQVSSIAVDPRGNIYVADFWRTAFTNQGLLHYSNPALFPTAMFSVLGAPTGAFVGGTLGPQTPITAIQSVVAPDNPASPLYVITRDATPVITLSP
jgi:hypothetical protein